MFKLKSYAKVNLGLNVYKLKQNETKHRLESFFVLHKQLFNEIEITKQNKLEVVYKYKNINLSPSIIIKSLHYLKNKFNVDINYKIIIKKNIPLSSGIGGSSTDAASIINFIIEQNNIELTQIDYTYIALNISSDIPFFLSGYNFAYVSNYGDNVEPLDDKFIPKYELLKNNYLLATQDVFKEFDKLFFSNIGNDYIKLKSNINKISLVKFSNDLEEPAFNLEPGLKRFKTENTIMTGSGSFFIRLKEIRNENKN